MTLSSILRRQYLGVFIALITIGICTIAAFPASSQNQCSEVQIGMLDTWDGVAVIHPDGSLSGVAPAILVRGLQAINVTPKFASRRPWLRILREVEIGKLDIIAGLYRNSERELKYKWLGPIAQEQISVFVLKENESDFSAPQDLIGRRGIAPLGYSFGDKTDKFIKNELDVMRVEGGDIQLMQLIASKRVDYGINVHGIGMGNIKKAALKGTIVKAPIGLEGADIYIGMSHHSRCAHIAESLNKALLDQVTAR